jgi:hypothetical protein
LDFPRRFVTIYQTTRRHIQEDGNLAEDKWFRTVW